MSTRIENPATPPGPAAAVARSRWPAVGSLSLGIFVIVTSEILPVGLLNPMAAGFGVTPGVAGLLLTLPGLTALIAAPVATVATARFDRRVMLTAFLLLLALANLLIAVAPSYPPVLLGRILVGVVIGGYWSIGAGLAPRVVRPEAVSTATAMIFAAVPVGSVLGVPLGTALGQEFGWRTPFLVLAVASTVIAAFGRWALPELRAVRTTSAAVLFGLVRERGTGVRTGLAVTALLVIAHFAAFTYVSPFLESATHAGNRTVAAYLLLYGVAGVAGTAITSRALIRGLRGTFVTAALLIAGCTALLPLLGRGPGVRSPCSRCGGWPTAWCPPAPKPGSRVRHRPCPRRRRCCSPRVFRRPWRRARYWAVWSWTPRRPRRSCAARPCSPCSRPRSRQPCERRAETGRPRPVRRSVQAELRALVAAARAAALDREEGVAEQADGQTHQADRAGGGPGVDEPGHDGGDQEADGADGQYRPRIGEARGDLRYGRGHPCSLVGGAACGGARRGRDGGPGEPATPARTVPYRLPL